MNNRQKLCVILCLIFLTGLYLNVIGSFFHNTKSNLEFLNETNKTNQILVDKNRSLKSVYLAEPSGWIINNRIAQYSSKIIVVNSTTLLLETLAQCEYDNQTDAFIIEKVKFMISYRRQFFLWNIQLVTGRTTNIYVNGNMRYMFKLGTYLTTTNELNVEIDQIAFALTDIDEYVRLAVTFFTDAAYYMSFHKPYVHVPDVLKRKKPAIAHCVHMVRNLDRDNGTERLFDWLHLQAAIGIDVVRLYMFDATQAQKQAIRAKFDDDYVQMADVLHRFEQACKFQIELTTKTTTNDDDVFIRLAMLDNCRRIHGIFLGERLDWGTQTTMELLVSNDCYSMFRNTHEYVSNYDFDEFILPRTNGTGLETDSCESRKPDFKLYDYVQQLSANYTQQNGRSSAKIAALSFAQVLAVKEINVDILDKLMALKHNETTFEYPIKDKVIKFRIGNESRAHLERLYSLKNTTVCLMNRTKGASVNFPAPFCLINVYTSKTIFNTNYTLMINQHSTFDKMENTDNVGVRIEQGFYTHFRANIFDYFDFSKEIPVEKLFIDLELLSLVSFI